MTRIAIAHEWLEIRAGSEKTFETMSEALPDADLYALTKEPGVCFRLHRPVTTTVLDRGPVLRRRRELTLPLMPLAWKMLRGAGEYDKVLTSSHACAKAFPPARRALHFCYCHTPMRYAWDRAIDTRGGRASLALRPVLGGLQLWDRLAADSVDHFAANSEAVRERVWRFYQRDAVVIHPPVDTDWYTPQPGVERRGALAVSRFIPYKRLDLSIRACAEAGVSLTVAGSGPGEAQLRRIAAQVGGSTRFEIGPSDERLRALYQQSEVVVFPAKEDFGMVAVEAQACGTPVVALDEGGARDTVIEGTTGYRVATDDVGALAEAVRGAIAAGFSPHECRANAERFSKPLFMLRLRTWMGEPT